MEKTNIPAKNAGANRNNKLALQQTITMNEHLAQIEKITGPCPKATMACTAGFLSPG